MARLLDPSLCLSVCELNALRSGLDLPNDFKAPNFFDFDLLGLESVDATLDESLSSGPDMSALWPHGDIKELGRLLELWLSCLMDRAISSILSLGTVGKEKENNCETLYHKISHTKFV